MENGRPEVVEEEAKTGCLIYRLFLNGKTINEIAQHLTDSGIPMPMGRKK